MKYVIYPVWAHRVRNIKDEAKVVNDDTIEVELVRGKVIMYERLARSFSIGDGHDLLAHVLEADRLQKEYDEDCESVRVYVYESGSRPVPVYAGRQRMRPGALLLGVGHGAVFAASMGPHGRPLQAGTAGGRYAGSAPYKGPANRAPQAARQAPIQALAGRPAGMAAAGPRQVNTGWQGTATGRIGSGKYNESNTPKESII